MLKDDWSHLYNLLSSLILEYLRSGDSNVVFLIRILFLMGIFMFKRFEGFNEFERIIIDNRKKFRVSRLEIMPQEQCRVLISYCFFFIVIQ